jgi:hypothetical protein
MYLTGSSKWLDHAELSKIARECAVNTLEPTGRYFLPNKSAVETTVFMITGPRETLRTDAVLSTLISTGPCPQLIVDAEANWNNSGRGHSV